MQRFFAKICGGEAFFSPSEAHHILDVVRMKEGDPLEVAAEGGEVYLARLVAREPLKALLLRPLREDNELPSSLYLGFSLLKGGHDELTLLKGTELGVAGFLPFLSERTVVRLEEGQREKRRLRFRRIVEEGAKQSKRTLVPSVAAIRPFSEILKEEAEVKVIAYEGEKENTASLDRSLASLKDGQRLLGLVGPEGGFSTHEVAAAKGSGFLAVGFGKRILRAETASLYLASVFSFCKEGR